MAPPKGRPVFEAVQDEASASRMVSAFALSGAASNASLDCLSMASCTYQHTSYIDMDMPEAHNHQQCHT